LKKVLKGKEFSWNRIKLFNDGIMTQGISLLLWMSPFLNLGIFFPLGVWILYFKNRNLRAQSFLIILVQSFVFILFSILELSSFLDFYWESDIYSFIQVNPMVWVSSVYGLGFLFLVGNLVWNRVVRVKLTKIQAKKSKRLNRMNYISWVILATFLAIGFSLLKLYWQEENTPNAMAFLHWGLEKSFVIDYLISLTIFHSWFSRTQVFGLTRGLYKSLVWSGFRRRFFLIQLNLQHRPSNNLLHNISRGAFQRNWTIPGWGHIYFGDFWKGFPLLFLFLLSLFLLFTAIFSHISPLLGIQYLSSWGLKPGIPDKEFFIKAGRLIYLLIPLLMLFVVYFLSHVLLRKSFHNLRTNSENERVSLRQGFLNYFPVSLLAHITFIMFLIIIPFTLQRQKPKDSKKDQASHFQPEKLEFYFIDPNIPEDIENLNGGVMTGTETPNQEQGEKITNEKPSDNGPTKGYVKKIRGKKVPATYSNYISAKMRGPENYLDYWTRAPKPYSSVVAYTITQDGDVTDIEMVEGSEYPDQDLLTLELIESLGPVMAPPSAKGNDIRVTELFWNGSLDPEVMPTPLQKEMVQHFDGRYMEEIE